MGRSLLIVCLAAASSSGALIHEQEAKQQDEVFQRYWGTDFEWKFDALPSKGAVAENRVPYSGYIYPDYAGGTIGALRKYDRAFHPGRGPAAAHEQWDTTAYRKPVQQVTRGLFGRRIVRTTVGTPHWHGHCNGWAAASMRHAEPKSTVTRNGVAFTPADIKALLAEIYIYNETENLCGFEYEMNAGTFHAIMTNWLGRASHPVAMEADPGEEKWNYPIFAYAITSGRISQRQVEVRMNISYAKDSRGEFQQSPRIKYTKYFHYVLTLDGNGKIVGGQFYRDSSFIDMVWVPVRPKQGRREGNERGNPHVDVDLVLSIWRDSVPKDVRNQWLVIDPPREDRLSNIAATGKLVPVQQVGTTVVDPSVVPASGTEVEVEPDAGGPPGVETASR